jgi:hypothetical protein
MRTSSTSIQVQLLHGTSIDVFAHVNVPTALRYLYKYIFEHVAVTSIEALCLLARHLLDECRIAFWKRQGALAGQQCRFCQRLYICVCVCVCVCECVYANIYRYVCM